MDRVLTNEQRDAVAYEAITIDGTAGGVALTSTMIQPTAGIHRLSALISIETAQIRYRYDGGAPTATEGHVAEAGDILVVNGVNNLKNFRAIRTTGVSATARVTYHQ